MLAALDQHEAATDAERFAASFRSDLDASLALVAGQLGTLAIPAGPRRRIDPGAIGSLAACYPLHLFPPADDRIRATVAAIRDGFTLERAFFQSISHTGLGTYLTLQLALVELESGDPRALDRLAWMVDVATPTWTWPEAIHPRLPGGCMGDGHHGWAAADFLTLVRNVLVREVPARWTADDDPGGLALCSMLPDDWLGQGVEVHDAPTHLGRLSFAVRWHGDRPALLWELEPHDPGPPVRLTAPGLDPDWSSTDPAGEALLAPLDDTRRARRSASFG